MTDLASFSGFSQFDPSNFESFSVKSFFADVDGKFDKFGVLDVENEYSEKENILARARQVQSETDDSSAVHCEPLSDFEKQSVFDRLNQAQLDLCHCAYIERTVYRNETFPLSMHILVHTGTDVILKQLAQDTAVLCVTCAAQDLDLDFLTVAIIEIIRLQKLVKKFRHPLRSANEHHEKVRDTLDKNFQVRTAYSHLMTHKSNGSRMQDDVMFLEKECIKSLTDTMFHIRLKSVLDIHHNNTITLQKKRPPQTTRSRQVARELALRYQDRNLTCYPDPVLDPPQHPRGNPFAGFWMQTDAFRP